MYERSRRVIDGLPNLFGDSCLDNWKSDNRSNTGQSIVEDYFQRRRENETQKRKDGE
jgi:hypothetical protein